MCFCSWVMSRVFKVSMFCGQFVYINLFLSFPISSPWSVKERGCDSPLLVSFGFSFQTWLGWVRDSQNVLLYRKIHDVSFGAVSTVYSNMYIGQMSPLFVVWQKYIFTKVWENGWRVCVADLFLHFNSFSVHWHLILTDFRLLLLCRKSVMCHVVLADGKKYGPEMKLEREERKLFSWWTWKGSVLTWSDRK